MHAAAARRAADPAVPDHHRCAAAVVGRGDRGAPTRRAQAARIAGAVCQCVQVEPGRHRDQPPQRWPHHRGQRPLARVDGSSARRARARCRCAARCPLGRRRSRPHRGGAVSARHRARDVEVALRGRGGATRQALVRIKALELQGEPIAISIVHDISAQRQAEMQEREQRMQLTHLTRVASLSEFSSALAHELNQPLTAILSNAQAALRFLARDAPNVKEIRAILSEIVEADKRAGQLIHHLRLLMKTADEEFVRIDLNQIVRDVLEFLHGELVTRDVDVRASLAPDLPQVHGDAVQLQQLVLNLVSNACDAMRDAASAQRTLSITSHPRRRRQRAARRHRHRARHRRQPARSHLRAVLHHQGQRSRARAADRAAHRARTPRHPGGRNARSVARAFDSHCRRRKSRRAPPARRHCTTSRSGTTDELVRDRRLLPGGVRIEAGHRGRDGLGARARDPSRRRCRRG